MVELTIHLSDDKLERLIERAREQGYSQPDDYLVALVDDDLSTRDEDDEEEAVSQEQFLTDLRQAILEIERGEGFTREEFRRRMASDE